MVCLFGGGWWGRHTSRRGRRCSRFDTWLLLSDEVSPTRQVWSVQGQISWRATRDPHGVPDGDARSIYCRLRVGCNAMLRIKVVRGALLLGSMLALRLQGRPWLSVWMPKDMLLPKTIPHPPRADPIFGHGCHRQGLLLVSARRGRQTTLCHGLAETDISPRGSGSEDLGHGWGRDSGDTGEALSMLGKGPMLPSI